MSSGLSERLSQIRSLLATAAPGKKITLIAVAKSQPLERIQEALAAGIEHLGENYAQEGQATMEALGRGSARWHFIGHIQSRKVKYLVDYDCVQSLDRWDIATALNERMAVLGKTIEVLVEVNVGGESQKSGISARDLGSFLQKLSVLNSLRVTGLMAMPPGLERVEERRPYFKQMNSLFVQHQATYGFTTLSMGTSEDYLIAAQEGSNMIRLGTVLLGARPATN